MIKKGISVSSGLGLAKAYKYLESKADVSPLLVYDSKNQLMKLNEALNKAEVEILEAKKIAKDIMSDDEAHIFDAHLAILRDPYFLKEVVDLIEIGHYASYSYKVVTDKYIKELRKAEDEYLMERSVDINDVYKKVMYFLNARSRNPIILTEPSVLVVEDLTPSDTIGLDFKYVSAIVSERGGKTSHAAIIARTLGIPSITGIRINSIENGDLLLVDGRYGTVSINPTEDELVEYSYFMDRIQSKEERLEKYKKEHTKTLDGHKIKLGVNISHHDEMEHIKFAEGVGLFRTEFLFMSSKEIPSLEAQVKSYETVLSSNKNETQVIRTLDVGGDKGLTYISIKKEDNPFLGQRAIRLSLANKQLFITQLKALLLANKWGNLAIMLPMISTLEEVLEAKELLENVKKTLIKEGHIIKPYQLGIMVEVPIVALALEDLIAEIDFVSIGSNDLIQYLFAADRMNEEVAYLYQPHHPALLKLIKKVVEVSHKYNKWVGVCGEMAGTKESSLVLLGLGVDELSMGYNSILEIRELIAHTKIAEAREFVEELFKLRSNDEVLKRVTQKLQEIENRIIK